jgi:hypothetical protein
MKGFLFLAKFGFDLKKIGFLKLTITISGITSRYPDSGPFGLTIIDGYRKVVMFGTCHWLKIEISHGKIPPPAFLNFVNRIRGGCSNI